MPFFVLFIVVSAFLFFETLTLRFIVKYFLKSVQLDFSKDQKTFQEEKENIDHVGLATYDPDQNPRYMTVLAAIEDASEVNKDDPSLLSEVKGSDIQRQESEIALGGDLSEENLQHKN